MARVRGSMVIPWVKAIRADKSGKLAKELTEADREIVFSTVYPSSWYPFEVYRNLSSLVARVLANNDEETIYTWGYEFGGRVLERLRSQLIVENSPARTIETYLGARKALFDVGSIKATFIDEKQVELQFAGFPPDFEVFYHLLRGWCARILAFADAENIKSSYLRRSWAGDPDTLVHFSWS